MSSLSSRLASLRRQSGQAPDPEPEELPPPDREALRERLQRDSQARRHPSASSRRSNAELAGRLGGKAIANGLIQVDRRLPHGHPHGNRALDSRISPCVDFFQQGLSTIENHEVVFMDTETTGLAGGTGTLVFLLGLGRLTDHGLHLRQYFLTGFSGEAAMLRAAQGFVSGARAMVTYNGKSFDAPLLATRYRLAGLADPFSALAHLDLLHPTRAAFAGRWPNCRLQSAERELLGFTRKDDLPGAEAPVAWFDWVRRGDTGRLPAVLEHNQWDMVTLAVLLPGIYSCFQRPGEARANAGAIFRHYRRRMGDEEAYRMLLGQRPHLDDPGLLALARLARQTGKQHKAMEIWSELTARNNTDAMEHLARHYEHACRDPQTALTLTRRLLQITGDHPDHRRREARLLEKTRLRRLELDEPSIPAMP